MAAPLSRRLRVWAREKRDHWVNQQLRNFENVRRQVERGEVDVLVLGDSTCFTGAAGDPDPAMIPEILGRCLDGARVALIAGPGYNARIHAEHVRLLSDLDTRPRAIVFSTVLRPNLMTHVRDHPIYSHRVAREVLTQTASGRHRIRSLGRGSTPTREEYAAFDALAVRTRWGGAPTIGGFRTHVKGVGPQPWPVHLERLLFDYFHGQIVEPDNVGLRELSLLGQRLRQYDVPVVAYWAPPPFAQGELLYPGEFTEHVAAGWSLTRSALLERADKLTVVEPALADEDFQDSRNGIEHFKFEGRRKIAEAVADALHGAVR